MARWQRLRAGLAQFQTDGTPPGPIEAFYPFVGLSLEAGALNLDGRIAYGALHDPGVYGATLTSPRLFHDYYKTQLSLLLRNHGVPLATGVSNRPIPLPFVVEEIGAGLPQSRLHQLQHLFPMPDLSHTDDDIANGTWRLSGREPAPLALFTAERVDYSLHRLYHYTGTHPEFFQRFVLLTNYQRYVDHFVDFAREAVAQGDEYDRFVAPGDVVEINRRLRDEADAGTPSASLPQMPAYHLTRPDGRGVTMVNIGVGPSNARTITDHVAVLRPHCWLMLGHCAGLRRSQQLGDYVLAHGYVREDSVLDQEVPLFVPVPPIAEVQVALQEAVVNVTGLRGHRRQEPDAHGNSYDHAQPQLGAALRRAVRAPEPEPRYRRRHGERHDRHQRPALPGALRDAAVRLGQAAARRAQAARHGQHLLSRADRPASPHRPGGCAACFASRDPTGCIRASCAASTSRHSASFGRAALT